MEDFTILIIIAYSVTNAFLALQIADHKGFGHAWFLAGLFFGVLGLIAAAGLPDRKKPTASTISSKECPDCVEIIHSLARVCRHCGHRFSPSV